MARKQCTLYERDKADAEAAEAKRLRECNEEHGRGSSRTSLRLGLQVGLSASPSDSWPDGKNSWCTSYMRMETRPTSRPLWPHVGAAATISTNIHVVHRYLLASGAPLEATVGLRVCACVWQWDGSDRQSRVLSLRGRVVPFDVLRTSSIYVLLQGRAHDVGLENDL